MRYYGLYANRSRRLWRVRWDSAVWREPHPERASLDTPPDDTDTPPARSPGSPRASWARLLRRILEVDPLLCPRCQVQMVVVSVITDPRVVDRILHHRDQGRGCDPFAERAPPGPSSLERTETPH